MSVEAQPRWPMALLCIVCGALPIGFASGLLPVDPKSLHAPRYIVALCGLLFWIAAWALVAGPARPRLNNILGAVLTAIFALIGGWVALDGSSDGFGGGMPFVSHAANVNIGRAVFGCGAIISAGLSLYAIRKAFTSRT